MRIFQNAIALLFSLTLLTSAASGQVRYPVEAFAKLPEVSRVEISPDGTHVAALQPVKGDRALIIYNLSKPGSEPASFSFTGFGIDNYWWIGKKRIVVQVSRADFRNIEGRGVEATRETRLVAVDRDGTKPKILMEPSKTTGQSMADITYRSEHNGHFAHRLIDDDDRFLAIWSKNGTEWFGVHRINAYTGSGSRIEKPVRGTTFWELDLQGIARVRGENRDFSYRGQSGEWKPIKNIELSDTQSFPYTVFTEDPRYAYIRALDEDDDQLNLYKYDFEADKVVALVDDPKNVDVLGVRVDSYTREIIGTVHEENEFVTKYLSPEWEAREAKLKATFEGYEVRIVSSSRDKTKHIVYVSAPFSPPVYYLWNEAKNKLQVFQKAFPDLDPQHLADVHPIRYKARDGMMISGYLTLPVGKEPKNLPTVIMPHGGPAARDYFGYDYLAQFLANRGYAVLQPNFRGSRGFGKKFMDAGKGEWGGKMSHDVTDGTMKLISQGIADPNRICFMGWSYGGYAAMIAPVVTPDLYQCSISINGVSDLPVMLAETKDENRGQPWRYTSYNYWLDHMTGNGRLKEADLINVSPARQAHQIKIPMLIIHSEGDRIVPIEQSDIMVKAMEKAGVPHKYVRLEGSDHSLDTEQTRIPAMKAVEAFLAQHLGN